MDLARSFDMAVSTVCSMFATCRGPGSASLPMWCKVGGDGGDQVEVKVLKVLNSEEAQSLVGQKIERSFSPTVDCRRPQKY